MVIFTLDRKSCVCHIVIYNIKILPNCLLFNSGTELENYKTEFEILKSN